ncbi:hypothetical protein HDU82_003558 [Entophlyctis luteolus]|nr:hypothetical protein HDU82_003558 [Entophlyctis luteolus]
MIAKIFSERAISMCWMSLAKTDNGWTASDQRFQGHNALGYLCQTKFNVCVSLAGLVQEDGDKEFHFVHANLLLERVPTIHFVFLLNEIVRVAKSGSFVQLLEMQKRGFELFAATNLAYYVKSEGKKAYLVYRAHRRVSIPLGYGNALERIHTRLRKQMFIRSADWMCSKMDMPLQEYLDLVESCFSEAVLEQEKPFVNYACVTFEVGSDNSHFFDL